MKMISSKKTRVAIGLAVGAFLSLLALIYFAGRPPESDLDLLIYYVGRHDTMFNRTYATLWRASPAFVRGHLRRPVLTETDREIAARSLKEMGPSAKKAIPALIRALDDPEVTVRRAALDALGTIALDSPDTARIAAGRLADPDFEIQLLAAEVLGRCGRTCDQAVAPLINLLKAPTSTPTTMTMSVFHYIVLQALIVVGPKDRRVVDVLFDFATGTIPVDVDAQGYAIASLSTIAPDSEQVAGFLDDRLAHETSPLLLFRLVNAVGSMKIGQEKFIGHLERIMREPPFGLRGLDMNAAHALWRLAPEEARSHIQFYIEHASKDYLMRDILIQMKAPASEVIPKLTAQIEVVPPERLMLLAETIWGIDPSNKEIVPRLRRTLESTNGLVRAFAAYSLWKVDGTTNLVIQILTNSLQEIRPSDASQTYPALLARMGAAAKDSLPALRKAASSHKDQFARQAAANAVKQIEADVQKTSR